MSGFCSGICNEISKCCYDFYHAPFTKKNLLIGGGIILGLIIVIIIIVYASKHGHSGPSSGKEFIKLHPLVDGANSLSYNIKRLLMDELETVKLNTNLKDSWTKMKCDACQTDLYRLKQGFVSTQVFSVSTDCNAQFKDAVSQTLEQIDLLRRIIANPANNMELITKADDVERLFHKKTTGVILNVWGGHNIDSRLAVLRMYYDLGVRIMSLGAYDGKNFCLPPWLKNSADGITDFGKKVIKEMNRLGMIIDLTGCPSAAQSSILDITKAPVIFSHSASYTITSHDLNIKDETLNTYKNKFSLGLVMIPFSPDQLSANSSSTLNSITAHLTNLIHFVGTDKVGIGSNFDNMTKTTQHLDDVSQFPALFDYLWNHPVKDLDLKLLTGKNFINVFKAVEKAASKTAMPDDTIIPKNETSKEQACYSDWPIRYSENIPTEKPTEAPSTKQPTTEKPSSSTSTPKKRN